MIYGWQSQDIQTLDPNLFALISSPNDDVMVRGLIVSKDVSQSNNYANKFEGTDADSRSPTFAGILQSGVWSNELEFLRGLEGKTLMTKAQTIQIFTGLDPLDLNLEIEFIAQRDTDLEVEKAIQQLEYWKAPLLKDNSLAVGAEEYQRLKGVISKTITAKTDKEVFDKVMSGIKGMADNIFGEIPNELNISFMDKRYNTTFVIESISMNEDKIMRHRDGGRIRQKVSLSLKSKTGITKNDLL